MRTVARAEMTLNDILTAAETLFVQKNYADVSMAEIATHAKVTKGALYHHFTSKEDLYMTMMLRDLAEKQAMFQTAVEAEGTCRSRLALSTHLLFQLPPQKRRVIQLVRRDINIFKGELRTTLIRAYQAALPETVEAILRDGIQQGELAPNDARLLAWQYVALVEVILTNYAQSVLGSPEKCVDHTLNLFLDGVAQK